LLDIFYDSLERLAPGAWQLNETMLALWDPQAYEHSWVLPDNFHVHIKVMAPIKERVHFLGSPYDVYYTVNAPMDEGRSLGANTIHSIDGMIVRELTRRCDFNPKRMDYLRRLLPEGNFGLNVQNEADEMVVKLWDHYLNSGYLSARILDYVSEDNLGLVNVAEIKELLDSLPMRPFKLISIHDCFRCLPHYANDLRWQYNIQLQLIAKSKLLESIISQLVGKHVPVGKIDPTLWKRIGETNYALS
jgi:hypothetical protein